MKGKYMGILYETVRAAQNNAAENEFSFNRSLETRERNDSDRRIVREVQEQKGQVSIEQVQEFQRPARDYASIGSDVKKALEKADQMDTEKEMPLVSTHVVDHQIICTYFCQIILTQFCHIPLVHAY